MHKSTPKYVSQTLFAACFMIAGLSLVGCSQTVHQGPSEPEAQPVDSTAETSTMQASEDELAYNLRRLSDRDYTDTYGDGENQKIWYTAAENLGEIGKPAIPALIEKLESDDAYEVMLALYALQLASQDEALAEQLGSNYLRLPSVLNPRANNHNRAIALSWWDDYKHLWATNNEQ